MTDSKQPEYTSTTGKFRVEHLASFIGQKVIVTVTPRVPSGTEATSTVAAGILAGAYRDRATGIQMSPTIYFQDGFKITVDASRPDAVLTISLIDES